MREKFTNDDIYKNGIVFSQNGVKENTKLISFTLILLVIILCILLPNSYWIIVELSCVEARLKQHKSAMV
jgi:hypothetical protein